jgi:hypothetical protein
MSFTVRSPDSAVTAALERLAAARTAGRPCALAALTQRLPRRQGEAGVGLS